MTQPSIENSTFNPDRGLAGHKARPTRDETVLTGQNLAKYALVGKISIGAATPAAGSNTGNGTLASATVGKNTVVGVYTLTCIAAATDGGRFQVETPDGDALADALVAVAYANDHLNFTIADGSTDFAVGDTFTITVAAGSGKVILSLLAAIDGSQTPFGVMADAVNATAADTKGPVFLGGEFAEEEIVFGTGHTAALTRDALRDRGIVLKATVAPVTA